MTEDSDKQERRQEKDRMMTSRRFDGAGYSIRVGRKFLTIRTGHVHYDIPLRQLATADGVRGWVEHLQCKSWVTRQMLRDFVVAAEHHGVNRRGRAGGKGANAAADSRRSRPKRRNMADLADFTSS